MTTSRWETLEKLFDDAVQVAPDERAAWLQRLDVDDELRRELAEMLVADGVGDDNVASLFRDMIVAGVSEILLPGQRIGAYRLLRELGSGGGGIVYLAERADGDFRQEVAIKVIRGVPSQRAVRQLRHERQILASLEHPNIARLLDGGTTPGGHPYFAMELIRGQAITDACKAGGVPIERRLALLADVARAVQYAHQRLIVHRDIKPGNVLLRDDGRPVLLDFGIAKLLDDSSPRDATEPWFTPSYSAPEQRRGGQISTATDVYALGLLLFELLTDAAPPPHGEDAPLVPSRVAPEPRRALLRGDLDRIVALATRTEPDERYSSAEALALDIDRYLSGQPVLASPDRVGYRLRKFVRRHRIGVGLATVALAALGFTTGWLAVERARADRARIAADAVTDFLVGLFEEAQPKAAAQRAMTPLELIDHGAERVRRDTTLAPMQRARLDYTLGRIYSYLGEPAKATATLEAAVVAARDADDAQETLALALIELAESHGDHGDRDAFKVRAREAVAIAERTGDDALLARALLAQGLSLVYDADTKPAEASFERARTIARRAGGESSITAAEAQSYLGFVYATGERKAEARGTVEAALAELRRQLPPDDHRVQEMQYTYATVLLELGEYDRAAEVAAELKKAQESMIGSENIMLAEIHNALGIAYYQGGRMTDAAHHLGLALETARRKLAPGDPELATYLSAYGSVLSLRGDDVRGIALLREAHAKVADLPAHDMKAALYRITLGRMLSRSGEKEESRRLLEMPFGDDSTRWALYRQQQRAWLTEWHAQHGDPAEALRAFDAADTHAEDAGGRDSARYAGLLRARGQALDRLGRTDEAVATLERAYAMDRKASGEESETAAQIALDLAQIARSRGDDSTRRTWVERARGPIEKVMLPTSRERTRLAELST